MASYPARQNSLKETLGTLFHQLDSIYIYLNEYSFQQFTELQDWVLTRKGSCEVLFIQGKDNIRDIGKFWFMGVVKGYIFFVDDDILYPPNYVREMVRAVKKHKTIITVHGRKIRNLPMFHYFADTESYNYQTALERFDFVDIAGTGTVCYHTDNAPDTFFLYVDSMPKFAGMADIWFACAAKTRGLDIIAIEREEQWLKDAPSSKAAPSLYNEFKTDTNKHCEMLNKIWTD